MIRPLLDLFVLLDLECWFSSDHLARMQLLEKDLQLDIKEWKVLHMYLYMMKKGGILVTVLLRCVSVA